jgi:putative ABC transport system permease protein
MTALWLDLRYALRLLAKTPGLTAVLLVTLALGIGATTTIFSVVHSVILRPLPYEAPDRLVRVYTELKGKLDLPELGVSATAYDDLRRDCTACASVAAWMPSSLSVAGGDRPVRVTAALATHSLMPTLGVQPALGRWFDASEDRPGPLGVLVIGYELWLREFAGAPGIIGRRIFVDGLPVTVIGVMPRGFQFPDRTEAWAPARLDFSQGEDGNFNMGAVIRLAPTSSVAALQDVLVARARQWTDRINVIAAQVGLPAMTVKARTVSLLDDMLGSLSTTLWLLQGAVLFVFLISVVNVANLLLARSETRTREVAVRHALGATRGRLIRQFLTESLVLAACGGALGILVAHWAIDGVTTLIPRSAPRADEIALDGTAMLFALACALAGALLFGLAPILHARSTDLHGALKDGSPRMTGSKARIRVRRALVIGELALAVVLVVGCTVMVRSFVRLQHVELGFAPDHLLTFAVELPEKAYPAGADDAFWRRLLARVSALPGVRAATLLDSLPPSRTKNVDAIKFPGRSSADPSEPDWILDFTDIASENLLEVLGARLTQGRALTRADVAEAPPVALVNEAFAAKFFRGRDPIGQRVKLLGGKEPEVTVVGVVADLRQAGLDQPPGTELFRPLWQVPAQSENGRSASSLIVALRTTNEPADLIPAVQKAVGELDPNLPVFAVRTMDERMWDAVARPRFLTFLLTSFAGIALLLAAVGIYGVMAHTVAQRTHEIGLRVALGARPAQVRAMVLRQAAMLVGGGVGVGLIAAIVLSATLGATLKGLFQGEPVVQVAPLVVVALSVTVSALLATWIPARRATRVQPTIALRSE